MTVSDPTGLMPGKTVPAGYKGITFFIEWLPGHSTGEIAIIGRNGVQLARVKWILDQKTGQIVANVVEKRGGKVLPGVARSALKKIMPKLSAEMAKSVQRLGTEWVLTRLATPAVTGGRVGLDRYAGRAGRLGAGAILATLFAFFSLENSVGGGDIERPQVIQIDPQTLGLSQEEIATLVEALEADLPDEMRAWLEEE